MRTADDAMLTVKLMIFYELTDIIKLVGLLVNLILCDTLKLFKVIITQVTLNIPCLYSISYLTGCFI